MVEVVIWLVESSSITFYLKMRTDDMLPGGKPGHDEWRSGRRVCNVHGAGFSPRASVMIQSQNSWAGGLSSPSLGQIR